MKLHKKHGLEEKSYANWLTDNLESKSGGLSRPNTNYSYCRVIPENPKIPQLFYQGNVYSYWRLQKDKAQLKSGESSLGYKIARKHLDNIRHRLEQRLKSAKAKGDSELISLLEKERQLIEA